MNKKGVLRIYRPRTRKIITTLYVGCTSLIAVKIQNITSIQSNAFGQDGVLNCVVTSFPAIAALVKSTCTYAPCPPLYGCITVVPTKCTYGTIYMYIIFVCDSNAFVNLIIVPTASPTVVPNAGPTGI